MYPVAERILRGVFRLGLPGGVLVVSAFLLLDRWAGVWVDEETLTSLARVWPPVFFVPAFVLAWWFHHRRLMVGTLVFSLAQWCLLPSVGPASDAEWPAKAVALLLPCNLLWIVWLSERGRLTLRGLVPLAALLLQPVVVRDLVVLVSSGEVTLPPLVSRGVEVGLAAGRSLPYAASMALGLAFSLLGVLALRRRSATDRCLLWALAAAALALVRLSQPELARLYFSLAGLVLLLGLVESAYSLAYEDELTGLPSRRALNDALPLLRQPYAVAIADVDHFKRFNDKYGHKVGDQALARVAAALRRAPGGGQAFRYGGEEFVLLFPGQPLKDVLPHLESLRQDISDAGFSLRSRERPRRRPRKRSRAIPRTGKKLSLTVSIGAAEETVHQGQPQQVLQAADRALYRAKKAGRNRVSK